MAHPLTKLSFLDQDGLDLLGLKSEGWEDHTPVTLADLNPREQERLAEIVKHQSVRRVIVNGRDYEDILCLQITTDFDFDFDFYCLYSDGDVALHNINHPQSYPSFARFYQERTS